MNDSKRHAARGRRTLLSRGFRISTPWAALGYGAFLLAAIAALAAIMIWQSYSTALRAGEAKAVSSAQIVAAHLEWMIEASDQALRRIDSALGPQPIRSAWTTIRDIREAVGDLPAGFQYSVYDETGHLRMSSVAEAIGIDVSDRDYFQQLQAGASIVISPQLEERLSGEQVFVIARRISRGDRFHGAASIAIPTRTMDEFWSALELGPQSTVTAIRADGLTIARHPQLDRTRDFSETVLFRELVGTSEIGFYHAESSPVDGVSRIVGYRKVGDWPLVATTGIEREEALASFRDNVAAGLAIGLPTALVMVLGTLWIASLLRGENERRLQLEEALERNRFLLREIHHRVKNNLQAVSSLIRLQPLPGEIKADISRRIEAMVAVHEQIYGSDQFDRIELAPYVERLVRDIAAGFPHEVEVTFELEPVSLDRERGVSFGLLVSEIVTNAYKYAFRNRQGRLAVRLAGNGENARLEIADDGPGYDPGTAREGMGTKLIAGFAAQVGGTLSLDMRNGTRVTVEFPVCRAGREPPAA